ncbi:MAG: hypothetical protein HY697_04645 [Deltaproteobacteria bacterium]|nr:hypothetical protein [Deltaproteobacteria bacterium]
MKIAGLQMIASPEVESNREKARRLIEIAAAEGARMICLPELFTTPWFPVDIASRSFGLAEEIPGPTTEAMGEVARKTETVLVLPFFERDPAGGHFNTAVVIDADGRVLGKYRKVHVPQLPLWEEKAYFQPGDLGFPVFRTRYGQVGIQICWDNFFPEGSRILALKGAQVIFAPTAAALASQKKWEKVICANAATNGVYILRVNRVGREAKQNFYGNSFCVSPEGDLLDQPSGTQEGVVMVNIDLLEIERTRRVWTFWDDRRPELYGEILGRGLPPCTPGSSLASLPAGTLVGPAAGRGKIIFREHFGIHERSHESHLAVHLPGDRFGSGRGPAPDRGPQGAPVRRLRLSLLQSSQKNAPAAGGVSPRAGPPLPARGASLQVCVRGGLHQFPHPPGSLGRCGPEADLFSGGAVRGGHSREREEFPD